MASSCAFSLGFSPAISSTAGTAPQNEICTRASLKANYFSRTKRAGAVRAISSDTTAAEEASSSSSGPDQPPVIDLEFLGPDPGPDGNPITDRLSVTSGEKVLRTVMNEQKLELYGLYGKVMNCGGGGSCGTCIVEILEGSELLNERTAPEFRYLKKKPDSWRLACQTIVGNKSTSGKVVVQRLPQRKK